MIWRENMYRYLSADVEQFSGFSRNAMRFEVQAMSKDKDLCISLKLNGGYCVYFLFEYFYIPVGHFSKLLNI